MNRKISAVIAALMLLCVYTEAKNVTLSKVVYLTNLHCKKCVNKIQENISYEKGVKDLSVDVQTKKVTIKFDSHKTDTLYLRKAINQLGYSARVVEFSNVTE